MSQIKGIDIVLHATIPGEPDPFGVPTITETDVIVNNVLIGQPSTDEIVNELQLTGRRLAYTLAIPKGDANDWKDKRVTFFGEDFQTIGSPTQGIEAMIPLDWNKKVKVERIE